MQSAIKALCSTTLAPVVLYSTKLKVKVRNLTRATVLAEAAEVADTAGKRNIGLLRHSRLEPGEGMWIDTNSVHTFFMRFPIDLVYLDKNKKVRKVRHAVGPWRLSACFRARSVLELPAGAAERTGTIPGDELAVEKRD